MGTNRDTDFTNLQPGDEISVIYTKTHNGFASNECVYNNAVQFNRSDAFVSKRQPRPLKAGDDFSYSIGFDRAPGLVRSIVHIDEQGVLYDYRYLGGTVRRYDPLPNPHRGIPVHVAS